MPGEVNTIYVSAASAADINTVSSEISKAMPTATVTTSSDLASEVTGSLSSASSLANSLGKWLAVAVLAAAFFLASILTMAAVARRVREFGTLKAIGWTSRRIIRQIMGESLVIGVIGGLAGIGVGYGAAAIVQAVAPPLTATAGTGTSAAGSRFAGLAAQRPRRAHRLRAPDRPGDARGRRPRRAARDRRRPHRGLDRRLASRPAASGGRAVAPRSNPARSELS